MLALWSRFGLLYVLQTFVRVFARVDFRADFPGHAQIVHLHLQQDVGFLLGFAAFS